MTAEDSFNRWMAGVRAGKQDAIAKVFNRFVNRLIALARTRLDTRIRQKEDPEDVVQSVFRSFFRRHANEEIDVRSEDSLWTVLTVIAVRKCANRNRHYQAECRDVRREIPGGSSSEDPNVMWEPPARDPSPEEAVMLTETVEELMRRLTKTDRQILELVLQGLNDSQISAQVGLAIRTVRRVRTLTKKHLKRMREEDAGSE